MSNLALKLHFILLDQYELPVLELDLSKSKAAPETLHWKLVVLKIVKDWVLCNQFGGIATLWHWQTHSQRFHADGISVFIAQCGLPLLFLDYLYKQMKPEFGKQLEDAGTAWIIPDRGWAPFCHIENRKVWTLHDVASTDWLEF